MTQWTYIQLQKRLQHEMTTISTERGRKRLRESARIVEDHLSATWDDPDFPGWESLLRQYEQAMTALGRRFGR
jgi:hypothetical protein